MDVGNLLAGWGKGNDSPGRSNRPSVPNRPAYRAGPSALRFHRERLRFHTSALRFHTNRIPQIRVPVALQ